MLNWARCVALANLCLFRIWVELFAYSPWPSHRDYATPRGLHYLAAAALCLLLGTAIYVIHRSAPFAVKAAAGGLLGLLMLKSAFLALSNIGWFVRSGYLGSARWLGLAALAVVPVAIFVSRRFNPGRLVRLLANALLPFAALTLGQSFWRGLTAHPPALSVDHSHRAPPSSQTPRRHQRVVWIIFDELDERIAFAQRPAGLRLPAFDRFRGEASFAATHASSPANSTSIAIPALLSGRLPDAPNLIRDTILEKLTRRNWRTAVIGWALPYCPELGENVSECAWWPMAQQHNSYGDGGFGRLVLARSRSLLESNHVSPFGQSLAVRHHIAQIAEMARASEDAAARPDLDFVVLHLPYAHNPFVWNPITQKPDLAARPWDGRGYLRNLQWADAAFAGIRAAMEASGVWRRSIVLVSADHGYRQSESLGYTDEELQELHVPFMLKSPVAPKLDPHAPLETLRTAEILQNLLDQPD